MFWNHRRHQHACDHHHHEQLQAWLLDRLHLSTSDCWLHLRRRPHHRQRSDQGEQQHHHIVHHHHRHHQHSPQHRQWSAQGLLPAIMFIIINDVESTLLIFLILNEVWSISSTSSWPALPSLVAFTWLREKMDSSIKFIVHLKKKSFFSHNTLPRCVPSEPSWHCCRQGSQVALARGRHWLLRGHRQQVS